MTESLRRIIQRFPGRSRRREAASFQQVAPVRISSNRTYSLSLENFQSRSARSQRSNHDLKVPTGFSPSPTIRFLEGFIREISAIPTTRTPLIARDKWTQNVKLWAHFEWENGRGNDLQLAIII